MEEKFINLFKETLEINNQEIKLNTKFRDLENWDSLSFLSILAMIDEEFDVVIEGNDFRKLVTIEDLITEIKKRDN
jgi:acyl carrier protein